MASFIWGFPPPSPSPVHPSVFCLLEAKSSTSASCWQTAGVLFSLCPASSASSSLSPSLLCFWLTSTSSWCLRVTAVPCPPLSQVFAVQSQGFPLRIRAFSGSLLPCPGAVLQPYLAQPWPCSLIWRSLICASHGATRGTGAATFGLAALRELGCEYGPCWAWLQRAGPLPQRASRKSFTRRGAAVRRNFSGLFLMPGMGGLQQ